MAVVQIRKSAAAHGREPDVAHLSAQYRDAISLIERLHRLLLDVVKDEFERTGDSDLNSVQALLLYNIGDEELSAGDLRTRGYYQGSNVSYNLKKLVDGQYLHHERCATDRRSVRIRATEQGRAVQRSVGALFERHAAEMLDQAGGGEPPLTEMTGAMEGLERFWRARIRYIY